MDIKWAQLVGTIGVINLSNSNKLKFVKILKKPRVFALWQTCLE
jgi:hypothetical protein